MLTKSISGLKKIIQNYHLACALVIMIRYKEWIILINLQEVENHLEEKFITRELRILI